jgi:DNA-binding PadR family transcriptional regulator
MKRDQTAFVILGILAIHDDQSGYELRKTIQQSVGFFWGESFGQIYPTLKRLAAQGLIVLSKSTSPTRPKRQEYSITPAGRLCLQEWLAVPYRDDPPRDEFLLKMFFASDAGPDVALKQVRRFQEKNRQALSTLQELQKLGAERSSHYPGFPYWMLTLDYGVKHLRMTLDWSDNAATVLKALKWPKHRKEKVKHG